MRPLFSGDHPHLSNVGSYYLIVARSLILIAPPFSLDVDQISLGELHSGVSQMAPYLHGKPFSIGLFLSRPVNIALRPSHAEKSVLLTGGSGFKLWVFAEVSFD